MRMAMLVRALAVWGLILLCAIANGVLREALLIPRLSARPGLLLSGLLLSGLILLLSWWLLPWIGLRGRRAQLLTGLGWLALTLGFEFSFGLLRGRTLDEILAAYRFEGGNLWPLVLLVTACAPWLVGWLRRR
ncbi:hypothetical protein MASR1M50_06040 [Burkholderiales bacterium]|mgnify:FL=1|jgi:hypothetical protein|nr:MAG: hypothetical protein BGO36_09565 [Burkholderiales bacterium 68-10]